VRVAFVDYVCDPAKPGKTGLSDLVWDMASRLAHLGDDVHVVAPYMVDTVPDPMVHVHRFELPPIGYRNIIGHLLIILRACRELRRLGKLDVIHTPEYTSGAVISSFYRIAPVVFTEPGNIYDRIANGNPYDRITTLVYKAAARLIARNCAHCFATSDWMKGWWQWTGVTPDRISLIPLGVDTTVFRPIRDARARLGIDNKSPIVLYAARLSRENGADVTLRAVARLRQTIPGLQLHVLGDGPEKVALQRLASQLEIANSTLWHGWVDFHDLPVYYSAADVLAFSGFSGGTPRVLLQAMACGTPAVASAIGGIVDHVRHGQTGLLFRAGRVEEMAIHIESLLADPRMARQLGQAGKAYVHSQVAWNVLVPRIREIYGEVSRQTGVQAQTETWEKKPC
jgi:D-inositol-3-phosphate glycosyltransferase